MRMIALATVAVATPMGEFEHEFIKFVAENNRRYATKEEYNARLDAFSVNHQFVKEFNKKSIKQRAEINHMGDWTREEYRQLLGYNAEMKAPATEFEQVPTNFVAAGSVDWRAKGAVTPIKNQG